MNFEIGSTGPSANFDGSTGPTEIQHVGNNIVVEKVDKQKKFNSDIIPVPIKMDNGQSYDVYPYKEGDEVRLNLSYESMIEFDLSVVPDLTDLTLSSKYCENLDLSGFPKLKKLTLRKTKIKELDISKNQKLENIMLFENENLKKLDISQNDLIELSYKNIVNVNNGFSSLLKKDKQLLVKYINEYVKKEKDELNWMTILDICYIQLIKERKKLFKEHVTQIYPEFNAFVVESIRDGKLNGKIDKKNTIEKYKTNIKKMFLEYIKKN